MKMKIKLKNNDHFSQMLEKLIIIIIIISKEKFQNQNQKN